jgi:hypothetical protein
MQFIQLTTVPERNRVIADLQDTTVDASCIRLTLQDTASRSLSKLNIIADTLF